jgi:hypothetical protein
MKSQTNAKCTTALLIDTNNSSGKTRNTFTSLKRITNNSVANNLFAYL